MRDVMMVIDLQFGSTGKGQIAGSLGRLWGADTTVCANGPNAGHTYHWTENGEIRSVVHTVMPVGAVLPTVRNILIGPGAVVDLNKLRNEIDFSGEYLTGKNLIIHPNAAILQPEHTAAEKQLVRIGSTMKGTAEAVVEKIRRGENASIAKFRVREICETLEESAHRYDLKIVVGHSLYDSAIDSSNKLLVEGAQGHSLSIHSQFYPYCTSRDVSINQIWADCRLPGVTSASGFKYGDIEIVGVCRTYPIRVANRVDDDGNKVGYSGDCYPDQQEINWVDIGRPPELTTVTRLPRRLFTFSTQQIMEAARFNAPTSIALTFCDYVQPKGQPAVENAPVSDEVMSYVRRIQAAAGVVQYLSYGPFDTDLYTLGYLDPDKPILRAPYLPPSLFLEEKD